jgi:ppGpp synthetase/RelA/SpoT-type nucleotidyltranferase
LVQKATASLPIYKIYGRDDKQGGMLLKHPRKIRLKFNSFCQDRGLREGSLWTVPDIIGFTVVVVFPSDINAVCQIVDKLIQDKKLFNASNEPAAAEEQPAQDDSSKRRATALIETRYGRALIRDGYFACHYNVRRIGIDAFRPICEIQIKTVLHDAWGAKSHDLTYKPSGKISQELILNFNLLGDSLAKLDEQSDLVRRTIERTARVRDLKRRRVQETTIVAAARNLAKDNETLRAIVEAIELGNEDAGSICGKLTELFAEHKRAVCTALSLLSVKTNSADYFQQTLEHIESWFESETTDFRKASSKSVAALSAYSVGDPGLAIEMGEVAVELIELARKNDLDDDERLAVERTANAIYSSMAYYHADRIGSHEGELGKSRAAAIDCMNKSLECRRSLNQLPLGLDSPDDAIEAALRCKTTGWSSFCALDNDAFVRIQTSTSEPALRAARERFEFVHKERAIEWMSMAGYLHDYHDYCARARLAELETETETEIK